MVRPSSLALVTLYFITIYFNRHKLGLILYKRYSELLTLVAIEFDSLLRRPHRNLMGTTLVALGNDFRRGRIVNVNPYIS